MKFHGLQGLTLLAIQGRPSPGSSPADLASSSPPVGTPSGPPGLSLAERLQSDRPEKLDSDVYSPNIEPALWALLHHPDSLLPQGKKGFAAHSQARHAYTSRDWPRGGASRLALQQESLVRHEEGTLPHEGHSVQRQGNVLSSVLSPMEQPGSLLELPFLTPTMRGETA